MEDEDLFGSDFDDSDELLDDDDVEEGVADTPAPQRTGSDTPADDDEKKPQYATVYDFVEQQLSFVIQRKLSVQVGRGLVWDPAWWRYPEVVVRLSVLHRAWEAAFASEDPSALSTWWLHHCDPMMDRILNGESGPFHAYDANNPTAPVPPGLEMMPRTQENIAKYAPPKKK